MHSLNFLSLSLLSLSLSASAYRLQARQTTISSGSATTTTTSTTSTVTSFVHGMDEIHFIESVCNPTNSTNDPDVDAPCYQFGLTRDTCAYGNTSASENQTELAPADQQTCFCQGSFWQYFSGSVICRPRQPRHFFLL